PERGGWLYLIVATELPIALVGQHQDTERAATGAERHQKKVVVAERLRQQLAGLDVVQAVGDDHRLLGYEDPADQRRCVGAEAELVETQLVEEPALPHPGRRGRRDQRLE